MDTIRIFYTYAVGLDSRTYFTAAAIQIALLTDAKVFSRYLLLYLEEKWF